MKTNKTIEKIGIPVKADQILKEIQENKEKVARFKRLRNILRERLEEEEHNIKRWEKRKKWLETGVDSIRKMDNDLSLFSNVLRTKKKEFEMSTEIEKERSKQEKSRYSQLLRESSEIDKGIPSMRKLELLSRKVEEISERLEKEKGEELEEIQEEMKDLSEEIKKITQGGGESEEHTKRRR